MKKVAHILIIDDDYITTFLTKSMLEQLQVAQQIHLCYDGQAALDFLETNYELAHGGTAFFPEVILLDLNMPTLDGFEFLKAYEQKYGSITEKVSIYIITTSSHPKDIARSELFRVAGFLNKPITEEKLKDIFMANHFQ
ncbi:response regulator [Rhodocytophaga rosea]|uniref:Response regulator n=1 Tax=Rhodocytophaga rosea TaxID=2704465 RepID=A0A6C0GGZ5_9BACT|nr:response regulator [Rhodocytophaga rosea]QHT67311.1 response regulator [Rhodocytophaga rosea]